jgi:hypothetical protein
MIDAEFDRKDYGSIHHNIIGRGIKPLDTRTNPQISLN